MKKINKVLIVVLILLASTATLITVYGFTGNSPAEIIARLSGKKLQEVTEERFDTGKTYGQIAYEEGLWKEFRDESLESKKEILEKRIADGTLSLEESEEIYSNIETMQEYCIENGSGFGMRNNGNGYENGYGMGNGFGNGANRGSSRFGGRGNCRVNRSW